MNICDRLAAAMKNNITGDELITSNVYNEKRLGLHEPPQQARSS